MLVTREAQFLEFYVRWSYFCILKGLRHNFGLKFNFCIFVLYNKRPIGPNGNQSKQLVEKSHICI